MSAQLRIGIDEVGRGPLAGPVAVGVATATPAVIRKFKNIKESKQLSRDAREAWYKKIADKGSGVTFAVSFISARTIDRIGINRAISSALTRGLKKLAVDPKRVRVLLDGGLRAPKEYIDQTTIVRGDASETIIAIASVVAKVQRDRLMTRRHKQFPEYGFAQHAGYGTRAHALAIKKYGLTPLHRVSFCGAFKLPVRR